MDTVLWFCPSLPTETLKWLSSLPILMQESFWWWQCSDRYILSLFPHLHTPFPPFSPSLISLMVSVDVKHRVYLLTYHHRLLFSSSSFSSSSHFSVISLFFFLLPYSSLSSSPSSRPCANGCKNWNWPRWNFGALKSSMCWAWSTSQ